MGAALRRVRAAVTESPRWLLARGVLGTNPPLAALAAVLALLTSLVPTAASLATGLLVGSLAPAVAEGAGSRARQRVALAVALLGALFVLQQLLGPLSQAATDALGRRYMAVVYRRVSSPSSSPVGRCRPWP